MSEQRHALLETAKKAYENSYAPYSGFHVGAALLCADGTVFTGCNVENAAGTSICAERTAVVKAISEGEREFVAIAIACEQVEPAHISSSGVEISGSQMPEWVPCYPCGACRQFLYEFAPNLEVIVGEGETHKLRDLLPHGFGRE